MNQITKDSAKERAALGEDRLFTTSAYKKRGTAYAFAVITWNEGERVRSQLRRMSPMSGIADIIVVDGESDDGSITESLLRNCDARARLVVHERGLGSAIRAAIEYTQTEGYDGLILVDGNGKDGVEALPKFVDALERGVGLAQGSRFLKGGLHRNTPGSRLAGIHVVVRPLIRLASGFRYTDPTNGFRAMSMRYLRDGRLAPLRPFFRRFNLQLYLVARAPRLGYRVEEIPVSRVYPEGKSVPTKITRLRTKLLFLWELLMTVSGRYNPRPKR